jgi:hypothetical protein
MQLARLSPYMNKSGEPGKSIFHMGRGRAVTRVQCAKCLWNYCYNLAIEAGCTEPQVVIQQH